MALTDPLVVSDHGIASHALNATKNGYRTETLTRGVTLDETYPGVYGPDPGGAGRTIVLDGAAGLSGSADPAIHGLMRTIVNRADAAEDLTVNDADGNTIGTISQNESADYYHDGIDADGTAGTGWALIAITTIALS